jgi:uncharacterized membrane protein
MLIVFPLGLLGLAAIFDIIYLATGTLDLATASYWMIAAGVVAGLLAAVFGFWDWLAIPGKTRAKNVGLLHGVGNLVVVGLFAAAWLLRLDGRAGAVAHAPDGLPVVFEITGLLLAVVSGWLGGELVERLGVGVDEGAHLQASSSLSTSSARAIDGQATRSAPRRAGSQSSAARQWPTVEARGDRRP